MPESSAILTQSAKFPKALSYLFQDLMEDNVTPVRYKVSHGGRGAAKTKNYARAALMLGTADPLRVMCTREFQVSIKQSVHRTIADEISELGLNYLWDVQQSTIKHREHDSEFFFEGLHGNMDKIKSYANIGLCWIEEGHSTRKESFLKLDPTVRGVFKGEPRSQIWISMNVELETDFMYDFFVTHTPANAIVRHLTWRDNPWFPDVLRSQMEAMKISDYDSYLNVWEGQPRLLLEGAVYAEELRAARAGGRICNVPYEPSKPIDVTWDLGYRDKTAIWLAQQVGFELRFVDYYENSQKPLSHYLEWLQARKSSHGQHYVYGMCNLPHDAKAKQLGTKLSVEEQLVEVYGRRNVRLLPCMSLVDGINAARTLFPNCYFDKARCADGLQALSHYRYEVQDDGGRLSRVPIHDETSHGADSFRYVAMSRKMPKASNGEIRARMQARLDDITQGREEYVHGRRAKQGQFKWMQR